MRLNLTSDPVHYTKSHDAFCKKSSIDQCKNEWFQDSFPEIMKPIICRWHSPETKVPAVRVLGIGSADGKFDFKILNVIVDGLIKANPNLSTKLSLLNRVVEPSSSSIDGYKECSTVWSKGRYDIDASFELVQDTFQDYAMKEREAGQFQFIHFLSSIYYMNAEEALVYCMEKELAENGSILLLTSTENSFWATFHNNGICRAPPGFTFYSSEDLISIAKKYNWRYESHHLKYWFDATELFKEASDDGSLLADFLTHTINFRGVTEKAKYDAVMKFWEEEAKTQEDGRRLMWCEMGMLFLHK